MSSGKVSYGEKTFGEKSGHGIQPSEIKSPNFPYPTYIKKFLAKLLITELKNHVTVADFQHELCKPLYLQFAGLHKQKVNPHSVDGFGPNNSLDHKLLSQNLNNRLLETNTARWLRARLQGCSASFRYTYATSFFCSVRIGIAQDQAFFPL